MLPPRLNPRAAGFSSRGGFTLVELLVVIGIIAILAGVALGPITSGIKKAKQSAGMQTVRSISLAEFSFSNDNGGAYPDTNVPTGNSGSDAATVAKALLAGSYVSDPSVFYINGGTATKYVGADPTGSIAATNISFDFAGNKGNGVTSNFPDQCPVAWSSVVGGTEPTLTTAANTPLTATPATTNPFGTDGIAVAFKSNSSQFIVSSKLGGGTPKVTLVDQSWQGNVPTTVTLLQGGG